MRSLRFLSASVLLVLGSSSAAQDLANQKAETASLSSTSLSAGLGFGTRGMHVEAEYGVYRNLSIGLHFDFAQLSTSVPLAISGRAMEHDATGKLSSASLLFSYYPSSWVKAPKGFHITAGLAYNFANSLTVRSDPEAAYTAGDIQVSEDEIGFVNTSISSSSLNPYLGIGYRNAALWGRFGLGVYAGAYYHGAPKVSMEATKMLSPSSTNAAVLADNLRDYQFYPNVTLSLLYTIM